MTIQFFDAHIHFLHQCPLDELIDKLGLMEKAGFAGLDVLVLSEFPSEIDTVLKMIPGEYHHLVTPRALENQKHLFTLLNSTCPVKLTPFWDARFIGDDAEGKVKKYRRMGFKGLKLLYVPEEDEGLQIGGMEKTLDAHARNRRGSHHSSSIARRRKACPSYSMGTLEDMASSSKI